MLNECSPGSANRVVALHSRIKSEEGGVAVAEPRVIVRKDVSRAALYLAHINARPQEELQAPVPVPKQPEKTFWSSVLDFLVEGFANCGALYPVVHLSADGPFEMEIPVREAFAANGRRLSRIRYRAKGRGRRPGAERSHAGIADLPRFKVFSSRSSRARSS